MSLANDLLNSLPVEEEDRTLVIDHYSRSITIPKSITTLGVETDDSVLTLDFRMPRYLNAVDLSNFSIRVNYINAEGEDGFYKVTDSRVVGNNILFSWRVGPTATAYKGNTMFNVEMVNTDTKSTILNEYNTAVAKLPVLEGLEVTADSITRYTDILEQWESRLFGISGTEEAKLLAISEEQQEYLVNKGAEVLGTIPADYTTASRLANKAERTKADAIICSAEGEVVKMEDSSDDYLRGLKIFGKTNQVKTTGAQLVDFSKGEGNKGITATFNNNTLKVVGDGSAEYQNYGCDVTNVYLNNPGKTLYFVYKSLTSASPVDGRIVQLNIKKTDNTWNYIGLVTQEGTKLEHRIPDDVSLIASVSLCVYSTNSTTPSANSVTVVEPMLQFDKDAKAYEPYSGGFASPSPNYSQPLNSIAAGNKVGVSVFGKNLCDPTAFDNMSVNGTTAEYDSATHTLTFTADTTGNPGRYCSPLRNMLVGHPYTISFDVRGTAGKKIIGGWDLKKAQITLKSEWARHTATLIATRTNEPIVFYSISTNAGGMGAGDHFQFANVQIEYGDTATEYEEYKPKQSMTVSSITNGIPGVPVTSGGNYTDFNGQQWICDEVDLERGVYVKRIGHFAFTGTESWAEGASVINGMHRYYTWLYDMRPDNSGFGLCNRYPRTPLAAEQIDYECVRFGQSNVAIFFFSSTITTVADWSAHVASLHAAGDPIKGQYVLTTPIETPLTAAEIEAFKTLYTNFSGTTIINDSGANMKAVYNADTKTWIENLIESKIAAYLQTN